MRKQVFNLFLGLTVSVAAIAQPTTPAQESYTFSLQQCIDFAKQNQLAYKNTALDVQGAKGKVAEVQSIGLPQVNISGQFLNNAKVQSQFVPAGAFSSSSFTELGGYVAQVGQVAAPSVALPPSFTNPSTEEVSAIALGVRYSSNLTLTASQLIFDGSFFVGLSAAKALLELSKKSLLQSEVQLVENVTKAYYLAVINKERKKIFDVNLARIDSSLAQLKASRDAGFVENVDVMRLEVTRNNLQIEKDKFTNIELITNASLKLQLGFPQEKELIVADQISTIPMDAQVSNADEFQYSKRAEYNLLESRRRLLTYDISQNEMGYLPRLAAFGNYGVNTGHIHLEKLNDKWANFYNFGLSLSIPVFDGLNKSSKIQQARVNLNKADNDLLNIKQLIDFQREQSKLSYLNALKSLESQKKNLALAEEVARVSKLKYMKGVGSNLEVINAESTLKETQINYFGAMYDAVIAKVDYDKANGNLK